MAAVNKFSDYLKESGFYFCNINNPNSDIYGNVEKPSKKIKKEKDSDKDATKKKKADSGEYHKLTTYLKIVNSIQ